MIEEFAAMFHVRPRIRRMNGRLLTINTRKFCKTSEPRTAVIALRISSYSVMVFPKESLKTLITTSMPR